MRRFSTILLYVTIAFLLLWQLPWCYNFFVVKPEKTPFTLYSFVIGDFAQMGQEEGKGSVRRDLAGNIYSEAAFDSIRLLMWPICILSDWKHWTRDIGYSLPMPLCWLVSFAYYLLSNV